MMPPPPARCAKTEKTPNRNAFKPDAGAGRFV